MADAPEVKDAVSIVRNRRTDAMFVAAYVAVGALCYVVIYETKIGEFAQGIVTLVLGMFLNELKSMYSYETGTTRSAQTKDATIKSLAESAPLQTAVAVAAARAPVPDSPISTPSTIKAENVSVEATTATLTERKDP